MVDSNFFYKNNRLQQLRGFCFAVQFGNISHAAKHLNSTHATVSLQIKSLENDLGVQLFKREGPKISVTPAGKRLYKLAIPSIQSFHDLIGEFNDDFRRSNANELQVGANDCSLMYLVPKILSGFCKERPKTNVEVHRYDFDDAMEKLLYEKIEVYVAPRRSFESMPKGIRYIPIFDFKPVLVTCPNHPLAGKRNLTPEEILAYNFTVPPRHMVVLPGIEDYFPEKDRNEKIRIDFSNWELTHPYVATGLVVEVSSDIIVNDDTLVSTPLDHMFPDVTYGLFVADNIKFSRNLEVFESVAEKLSGVIRQDRDGRFV